jgi:hypothetical protein
MIWLCQYLCPSRHAIVAVPYEVPGSTEAEIEGSILAECARQGVHPWCGICAATTLTKQPVPALHFEHAETPYATIEEARLPLQREARKNALARRLFGGRS